MTTLLNHQTLDCRPTQNNSGGAPTRIHVGCLVRYRLQHLPTHRHSPLIPFPHHLLIQMRSRAPMGTRDLRFRAPTTQTMGRID